MKISEKHLELFCGLLQKTARMLDMIVAGTIVAVIVTVVIEKTPIDATALFAVDMVFVVVSYTFDSLVTMNKDRKKGDLS